MKKIIAALMSLLIAALLAACGSAPTQAQAAGTVGLTGVTSYYVRANGNDSNAGTSEDAPFRTLERAVEAASRTTVKKITVIGTLQGFTTIEGAGVPRRTIKYMDATGGQDLAQVLANNIGNAMIDGNYNEPNTTEILITGKPNASDAEKAVLTNDAGVLLIIRSAIRLENLEISGSRNDYAIGIAGGELTLAKGVKITRNGSGILAYGSIVIMRDDAEVSYNEGRDNVGIDLEERSVGVLLDNALVAHNKASNNGGGITLDGSTLIMADNASVSGNSAGNAGGGIITFTDTENGLISRITISDNASISKNSANEGGGILLQDQLYLRGNARITENTAITRGGGILGVTNFTVSKGENVIISNNQAPVSPDMNFTFN